MKAAFLIESEAKMSDTHSEPRRFLVRHPITYWSCKRRIQALRKYQDLVRHRERSPESLRFAQRLEDLIGPFKDQLERMHLLEQEIARLSPIVFHILQDVGVPTSVYRKVEEFPAGSAIESTQKEEKYDLIVGYLQVPVGSIEAQRNCDLLVTILEEGIGMYQSRKQIAWREIFYPTVWLAYIVRLPITILERAGVRPSDQMITDIYGKLLQAAMLVLIVLLGLKLGFTIPWERIITNILK